VDPYWLSLEVSYVTHPQAVLYANHFFNTIDRDIPFCGGNCTISDPSIPALVQENFANASYFDAFVVPGAGHGLNLVRVLFTRQPTGISLIEFQEYTWPVTYKTMLDFFDEQI
jgi:hypothetical protein